MTERRALMPGPRAPLVDKNGHIDPIWHRFLIDLYERTGGGSIDKVDLSAGAAEDAQESADAADAAALAAQTAANNAQSVADSIEDRIDFDFDFDLR